MSKASSRSKVPGCGWVGELHRYGSSAAGTVSKRQQRRHGDRLKNLPYVSPESHVIARW